MGRKDVEDVDLVLKLVLILNLCIVVRFWEHQGL